MNSTAYMAMYAVLYSTLYRTSSCSPHQEAVIREGHESEHGLRRGALEQQAQEEAVSSPRHTSEHSPETPERRWRTVSKYLECTVRSTEHTARFCVTLMCCSHLQPLHRLVTAGHALLHIFVRQVIR